MKATNTASALPIIRILKLCGLWSWTYKSEKTKWEIFLQKVYPYLLQVNISFVLIILMWIGVFNAENILQAGDVLYLTFTETAFAIKVINIRILQTRAVALLQEIENDAIYRLRNNKEREFWTQQQKLFKRVLTWYIGGSLLSAVMGFFGIFFRSDYVLPYSLWTPFDWHIKHNYWIVYSFEVLSVNFTCVSNSTLDMLICYYLFHVASLYKIVGMRLKRLSHLKEEIVLSEMREIFILHGNLKRLTSECETLITAPILAQILFSALTLCFTGYILQSLNFMEEYPRFITLFVFLAVMALQIYLPCYYANEITVNANDLTTCIYFTNWYELSVPTRKLIILYMEFLKRPVLIKTGKLFEVGLPIFAKTINNAYSFLAILLNMEQ